MRLLVVGHEATRTGSPIVLRSVVRWLSTNTDWSIDIAFAADGELRPDFERCARRVQCLQLDTRRAQVGFGVFLAYRLQLDSLARALTERRLERRRASTAGYNVVYLNSANAIAAIRREHRECGVVAHVHELLPDLREMLTPARLSDLATIPDAYIAASDEVRRGLVDGLDIDPARITTIRSFIEPPSTTEPSSHPNGASIPPGRPVVLACGSITPGKGADLFLDAAAIAAGPERPLWVWLGARDRPADRAFAEEVRERRLVDDVRVIQAVDDPAPFFARADVFALPSRRDAFPLVALEAAYAARPIVCFDGSGGAPELVRAGAGVVVPAGDATAFAEAVLALIRDRRTAERMGACGAELVRRDHITSVKAPQIAAVLQKWSRTPSDRPAR